MIAPARKSVATLVALALATLPRHADTAGAVGSAAAPTALVVRLEAALLLQTLNAELLGHDSASLVLERWCSVHRLGTPARIVAQRVAGVRKAPTQEQRQTLRVAEQDEVRYRRVRLVCGGVVLSEADNWYVPARLTAAMNQQLDSTDTPFGLAVRPLNFQRHTLAAQVLWAVLPPQWEMRPTRGIGTERELCLPPQVLQHRAVLTLPDGTPFSEVVETYTRNVLAVPALGSLRAC
jgi:chorismate-pyruvate lyase